MLFVSELLTYLFKFIVLGAVTIVAVLCGIKYKKNKVAKGAAEATTSNIEETEN